METVPFPKSHHVVVNFFVEILVQGDGLDDHGVDLVRGELELESSEPVSQTKGHFTQSISSESVNESSDVESDAPHELKDPVTSRGLDVKVFLDDLGSVLVGHRELILDLLGDHIFLEEGFEGLGHFAVQNFDGGSKHVLGVLEWLEGLEFNAS